ncbi:MAG: DUF11 domain-containing protein [bacterium]
MARPVKTPRYRIRGLLLGLTLFSLGFPAHVFSQNICDNPILISGPVDTLLIVPDVVVRADTIVGLSNPAACVSAMTPGYYRISSTISRSLSQINESYFMTVCDEDATDCREVCNPNAGAYRVVVDDTVSTADTVTSESGIFFLDSGKNLIMFNHFELIADQFPQFVMGDTLGEPSSVHLLGMIIERTDNTYDLELTQSASQDSVRPDSTYSYDLRIQNTASATTFNIELQSTLPEFVTLESFLLTPANFVNSNTLFWNFDSLAAGQKIDIRFSVNFSETRPTTPIDLISRSQITGNCDTTITNNIATTTVVGLPPIQYDLELSKSASRDSAQVLQTFAYFLKLVNKGPDLATDIVVRDALPSHLRASHFSVPPAAIMPDLIQWQFQSLAVGDSIEITYDANILATIPQLPSLVTNTAIVSAPLEINANNNSASAMVRAVPMRYDLELLKSASKDSVQIGRGFSYNLIVVNRGPDPASDIVLSDVIPSLLAITGFSVQPSSTNGDTLFWRFDSLAVTDSITVSVNAKIVDTIPSLPAVITNMATVTAPEDFNTTNSTASALVTAIPMRYDLEIANSASADTVRPGRSFLYSIVLTNKGPDTAESVLIRDLKPQVVKFSDFSLAPTTLSGDTVFWQVDSIAAGETLDITINAQMNEITLTDPMAVINSVSVTAADDFNASNNNAAATVTVLPPDDCLYLDRNVFTPAAGTPLQINFQLSTNRRARLDLYDATGYHLGVLAENDFNAGTNTFLWDGGSATGKQVGSGVYIITLRSGRLVCWVKTIVVQ